MAVKTDAVGFVRDEHTAAILNTNNDDFVAFKARRDIVLKRNEEITELKTRVEGMESTLQDILQLLKEQKAS